MAIPVETRTSEVGVVTVDDQALFRRVAREVVEATPGFVALGEAESGEEALRLVAEVHPELVLVDVRMPGMDGVETAGRIAAAAPDAVIVLVTAEHLDEVPAEARVCGAATVVAKQRFGPQALRALWAAHGGRGA